MKYKYITDIITVAGGAEATDKAILERLSDLGIKPTLYRASDLRTVEEDTLYIISNRVSMNRAMKVLMALKGNYILIEHDYQWVPNRNPWFYNESIVPNEDKIDLDLYENAKATFFQTDFHRDLVLKNKIPCLNPISLGLTIFTKGEINFITDLYEKRLRQKIPNVWCVYGTNNYGKNTMGTLEWLKTNAPLMKIVYQVLPHQPTKELWLEALSKFFGLIFFPITPETCCRLVMEAQMLGLELMSNNQYGFTASKWRNLHGLELINATVEANIEGTKLIYEKIIEHSRDS